VVLADALRLEVIGIVLVTDIYRQPVMRVFKILMAPVRLHIICQCFVAESRVEAVCVRFDTLEIFSVNVMQQNIVVKFQHSELGIVVNEKSNEKQFEVAGRL